MVRADFKKKVDQVNRIGHGDNHHDRPEKRGHQIHLLTEKRDRAQGPNEGHKNDGHGEDHAGNAPVNQEGRDHKEGRDHRHKRKLIAAHQRNEVVLFHGGPRDIKFYIRLFLAVEMTAQVRAVGRPELGRAPVEGVKNIIAVGAGKGGVGKTTVSVNLAVALARLGSRVALLDGDMYGPNVPIMLGLKTQLETDGQKIVPAERYGLQVVSMGFLTPDDASVI